MIIAYNYLEINTFFKFLIYNFNHLAPRRVLVIDKWRRFAPPDKHTSEQLLDLLK